MRFRCSRCVSALVVASLCLAPALVGRESAAQVPAGTAERPSAAGPGTPTLSVEARLVNLPVVVRDKKGGLVANLSREDFVLDIDGRAQTIRYFDRDNDLPLTLGLLVDTSMSVASALEEERTAGSAFLQDMLASDRDKAFVVQFARSTELLEDLTSSRPKLQAALRSLNTESSRSRPAADPGRDPRDPNDANDAGSNSPDDRDRDTDRRDTDRRNDHSMPGRRAGGTTLYDALFLSSDEVIGKQRGRKALVILSDGEDNGSRETLAKSIEAAQRANAIVYAIYFKGEGHGNGGYGFPGGMPGGQGRRGGGYPGSPGGYPGAGGGGGYPGGGNGPARRGAEPRPDGKKVLERMARETGGRLFEVSRKQTIDAIYKQIAEELRAQYRLGYTPEGAAAAPGYHEVSLGLSRPALKSLTVQTREGYYSGK